MAFAKYYKIRDKAYIGEKGTHIADPRLTGRLVVVPARHFRCGGGGFAGKSETRGSLNPRLLANNGDGDSPSGRNAPTIVGA
jgi:hypothetical protein